jgi:hypothetical protein
MTESPIAILERWEAAGGLWRIRTLGDHAAEVELCTCHGEPVDTLQSTDPALLSHLARLRRSGSR